MGSWGIRGCFNITRLLPGAVNTAAAATAAAKLLQSCPTLCNPIDGSPPGSPVPGILQARHWSGLPFPSPMHESEKWKWSRSVVSNSQRPHGLQPTRLLCPWDFPGKSTGVGCHCLLQWIQLQKPKTQFFPLLCHGTAIFLRSLWHSMPNFLQQCRVSFIFFF